MRTCMLLNVNVWTTALINISYKVLRTEHEFICQMPLFYALGDFPFSPTLYNNTVSLINNCF